MVMRDWALRCGTAFSMLYEQLAKDVYNELYVQFYRHQSTRIWTTSIASLFELIDRYGFDYFESDTVPVGAAGGGGGGGSTDNDSEKQADKAKKTHRQLYNKMGYLDEQDDEESSSAKSSKLLETCCTKSVMARTGYC